MDIGSHHLWWLGRTLGVQGVSMNTQELRRKARQLYNNKLVPTEVNQHNQRKWVRSVLKLGDKWLLAKQVERLQ